jgi:uncharacterized protein YdaU (DUF1376 family)
MSNNRKDYTGKAPLYQQWAEKEFIFDTTHLHWQARLLYRALLQAAWHLSSRPDIPSDDAQLSNILGVPAAVWDEHKGAVRAMFHVDEQTGLFWQKRLREDWTVIVNYRAKQKELAERRWKTEPEPTDKAEQSEGISQGNAKAYASVMPAKQREEKQVPPNAKASPFSSGSDAARANKPAVAGESLQPSESPLPFVSPLINRQGSPAVSEASSARTDSHLERENQNQRRGQKKPSADVQYLTSVCHELGCQIPTPQSVQSLLDDYTVREIEDAFREYTEQNDASQAERLFYAEGGGAGVILARRRRAVGVAQS